MNRIIGICWLFALVGGLVFGGGKGEMTEEDVLEEILALEIGTYKSYYGQSDPTAWADLFAEKATYFDPWQDKYHEDDTIREAVMVWKGKIPNIDYEVLNPRVDVYGDVAVFVFNLECTNPADGSLIVLWKGTMVFRRSGDGWEKVHGHFSASAPVPQ